MMVSMSGMRKDTTQAIMDGILRFIAGGGFLTTALVIPNAVQLFDKPLDKLLKSLDKRSQEREIRRVIHYMKQRGLITYKPSDYENGIQLTAGGKKRLRQRSLETLAIPKPATWDKKWRLVFFDIPEELRTKRDALNRKLRLLSYQQLQKSIWIHPHPSRTEIEVVTEAIGIRHYVTYIEISEIDNEQALRRRFKNLLKS